MKFAGFTKFDNNGNILRQVFFQEWTIRNKDLGRFCFYFFTCFLTHLGYPRQYGFGWFI